MIPAILRIHTLNKKQKATGRGIDMSCKMHFANKCNFNAVNAMITVGKDGFNNGFTETNRITVQEKSLSG